MVYMKQPFLTKFNPDKSLAFQGTSTSEYNSVGSVGNSNSTSMQKLKSNDIMKDLRKNKGVLSKQYTAKTLKKSKLSN